MNKDGIKRLNVVVSFECWKKLKILSIQKEISIVEVIREILEKNMLKKLNEEITI